jgi:hypothetical protein
MSEEPLTSQADTIIIVGTSLNAINFQLTQYNEAVGGVVIHKVTTRGELDAALSLPADTPWCVVDSISRIYYNDMIARFGMPQTVAACLKMENNEYAIHPSKLRD